MLRWWSGCDMSRATSFSRDGKVGKARYAHLVDDVEPLSQSALQSSPLDCWFTEEFHIISITCINEVNILIAAAGA